MNQSIVMTKQELRNRYLQRRNDLSVQERKEKSIQVLQNLQTLPEFQKAEGVLIYLNYRSEVETIPFVEELLQKREKRIFVPKVCGMDIRFYEITSIEDVKSGYPGDSGAKGRNGRILCAETGCKGLSDRTSGICL